MRTVSTAGGAPIRLTCFAHQVLPRAARLSRVSGLFNRARANGIDGLDCVFHSLGNREEGKEDGGAGEGTWGSRWFLPPQALRLDDEFLVTLSSITVKFAMREHVPDDRA